MLNRLHDILLDWRSFLLEGFNYTLKRCLISDMLVKLLSIVTSLLIKLNLKLLDVPGRNILALWSLVTIIRLLGYLVQCGLAFSLELGYLFLVRHHKSLHLAFKLLSKKSCLLGLYLLHMELLVPFHQARYIWVGVRVLLETLKLSILVLSLRLQDLDLYS